MFFPQTSGFSGGMAGFGANNGLGAATAFPGSSYGGAGAGSGMGGVPAITMPNSLIPSRFNTSNTTLNGSGISLPGSSFTQSQAQPGGRSYAQTSLNPFASMYSNDTSFASQIPAPSPSSAVQTSAISSSPVHAAMSNSSVTIPSNNPAHHSPHPPSPLPPHRAPADPTAALGPMMGFVDGAETVQAPGGTAPISKVWSNSSQHTQPSVHARIDVGHNNTNTFEVAEERPARKSQGAKEKKGFGSSASRFPRSSSTFDVDIDGQDPRDISSIAQKRKSKSASFASRSTRWSTLYPETEGHAARCTRKKEEMMVRREEQPEEGEYIQEGWVHPSQAPLGY